MENHVYSPYSTKFVNRKDEFRDFKSYMFNFYKCDRFAAQCIIVYAQSGLGKSSFVHTLLSKDDLGFFKVSINPARTKNATIESYCYLNQLYDAVIEQYKTSKLRNFLTRLRGIKIDVGLSYILSLDFGMPAKHSIRTDVAQNLKVLHNVFRDKRLQFVINIQNIQLIDNESLRILFNLCKAYKNIFLLLEYTVDEEMDRLSVFKLQKEFNDEKIACTIYELNKLKLHDVQALCESTASANTSVEALQELYEREKGNLYNLILYVTSDNITCDIDLLQVIHDAINQDERFILYCISLNRGNLSNETLFEIAKEYKTKDLQFPYIQECLKALVEKKYVATDSYSYQIEHDSLKYLFETEQRHAEHFVAYRCVENYYRKRLKKNKVDDEAIYQLLYLYSLFGDENLRGIFPEIYSLLRREWYPDRLMASVKCVLDSLYITTVNKYLLDELTFEFVKAAYDIGDMVSVKQYLELIYDNSNLSHVAFSAALLAKETLNSEAESAIVGFIDRYKTHRRLYLHLQFCLLSYYMRNHNALFTKRYVDRLLNEHEGSNEMGYYYILKNATEFMGNDEAIHSLNICHTAFSQLNRPDLSSMVLITMASRQAYMGEYAIAEETLMISKKLSQKSPWARPQYFLNNNAALLLLQKKKSKLIEDNLNRALLYPLSIYEKSIVLCNLLIYYVLCNKFNDAQLIVNSLINSEYENYGYEELLHIVYYNLYFFYKTYDNAQKMTFYKEKLLNICKMKDVSNDLKEYIRCGIIGGDLPRGGVKLFL